MTCSAIPSSSSVVTPGRRAARTASSASATTSPAARMSLICSGLLTSMRSFVALTRRSVADGGQRGLDARRDVVYRAHAVDLHEQAALGIDVHEGCRVLLVDRLTMADDLGRVVVPALLDGPLV